jgi:hypothetical protein
MSGDWGDVLEKLSSYAEVKLGPDDRAFIK